MCPGIMYFPVVCFTILGLYTETWNKHATTYSICVCQVQVSMYISEKSCWCTLALMVLAVDELFMAALCAFLYFFNVFSAACKNYLQLFSIKSSNELIIIMLYFWCYVHIITYLSESLCFFAYTISVSKLLFIPDCNCEAFATASFFCWEARIVLCIALDEAAVLLHGEAWIETQSSEDEAYY